MSTNLPEDAMGIVRRLVGPAGPEMTCEQCFDFLDVYVDLELGGRDADGEMPTMRPHLEGCPACREDHDSLHALLAELCRISTRCVN